MARVTIEMDEDFLADLRKILDTESNEEAVKEAAMRLAKLQRRREFADAIKSGEIDLMYDVRDQPEDGTAQA
ncbi:type II toxin-antitoxin system VapB family antitoxin [Streptomyces alboflavus]|uniref:type II toxin-antitoxin system VapB family antitoxin n=1 Tax=Streptomyces alboflavus TaxID=67267 RepID=UPI0036B1D477